MAKDSKPDGQPPEKYEDVVQRLDEVVKRLEGGQLSLEESLKAFEDGVRFVQKGERLLSEAEKRIEQLLHEDGEDKAVPLEAQPSTSRGPSLERAPAPNAAANAANAADDDDVPF